MASRNRPYDQFGPYILFKKLESDALTDLWRAARLDQGTLSGLIAFRRFHAGNREALVAAANAAREAATMLTGTSFVKHQTIDIIDNTPFIAHEYAGGRSLRHIVERARGGAGMMPNPIPLDQAVVIAERVALSVATMADLRYAGDRMMHGALIPQFVWISDDGEIRVAGQLLGPGIVASLRDAKVGAEIGRYFSPEYQSTGVASPASEIYSLGAILYLVVTGQEPPDPLGGSAFNMTIRSSRAMNGAAIPNDIRTIIDKSLAIDRNARYATVADMKKDLSALAHGGKYSATTFNLAFYLSSLLKKEFEGEAIDREKESKVQLAPYAEQTTDPVAPIAMASDKPAEKRRRLPLAIAAAIGAVAILGIGTYFAVGTKAQPQQPPPRPVIASAAPVTPPKAPVLPETIVVGGATSAAQTPAPTATIDEASAKKKAFEDAVKRGMQEQMMKLQAQYNQQLQQQQSKNAAPVSTPAPPFSQPVTTQAGEDRAISAAQLDQQRRDAVATRQEPAPSQQVAQQSASVQPPPVAVPQPAAAPAIQEGDLVDITEVDSAPRPLKEIHPSPPPLAIRQHLQGSVVVTVLVSETGSVMDAKVLSGLGRFGVDDAALRAVRTAKFSPALKNGKRVRVWMPLRFDFKL